MKKILLILIMANFASCSKEYCGYVTGRAEEGYKTYLQLGGDTYYQVHPFIYNNTNQGEYICL